METEEKVETEEEMNEFEEEVDVMDQLEEGRVS
jgi:hypothetical protein